MRPFICWNKFTVLYLYGMKTYKQFVNTLENNICARVEMSKLINDHDKYEVIDHAQSILRALFIDDLKK